MAPVPCDRWAIWRSDTAVDGTDGSYRAVLSKDWEIWGPMGGYVAAVALRATRP